MKYQPSQKILDKYADVLINYALNGGNGIKKGEVVFVQVPECAKPLLISLRRAVLKAEAYCIIEYIPDDIMREFYELANEKQLAFFPEKYLKGKVDQADHLLFVIAETDKHELEGIDPTKIMTRNKAFRPYMEWRNKKENEGKLSWTLGLYATEAMAKEVGMTIEDYWDQIIKACFLNTKDPIQKWNAIVTEMDRIKGKLNELKIEKVHVKAQGTDLTVGLGKNRQWLGGSGRNIPSFELFISPDWRITNGKISFNQPLYRYGNLVKDISLEFKDGIVTKATAKKGEKVLKEMIKVEGANKVGEFSLTDSRFSKITKFMGETLFDENAGGKYGNTHIALGASYKDTYPGDPSKITKTQWEKWGYNDSVIHTDIVSTTNREVTATLEDDSEMVIYKDGKFTI